MKKLLTTTRRTVDGPTSITIAPLEHYEKKKRKMEIGLSIYFLVKNCVYIDDKRKDCQHISVKSGCRLFSGLQDHALVYPKKHCFFLFFFFSVSVISSEKNHFYIYLYPS